MLSRQELHSLAQDAIDFLLDGSQRGSPYHKQAWRIQRALNGDSEYELSDELKDAAETIAYDTFDKDGIAYPNDPEGKAALMVKRLREGTTE